jgi:RecB family exonuclease
VEPTDFVSPSPAAIAEVSPSLANQLLQCSLRVAFARDPELRAWRRPSTYSTLGVAAHAVTEAAFKRSEWPTDETELREKLEERWDSEVERGSSRLVSMWSPATPPKPTEWPGYALTRARTIRRAMKLLLSPPPSKGSNGAFTGVELDLRDPTSGLVGRADRIERDGMSTRIVDLKTGLNQADPTEDQRRQLLMYAVLAHRASGEWPKTIAVEDASGFQHVIPLVPEEAESAVAEVSNAVEAFNKSVRAGDFEDVAKPSSERCRWCAFRVVCRPFWEVLRSDWDQRAVFGAVIEMGSTDAGEFVVVKVESPEDRAGQTLHVSAFANTIPPTTLRAAIVDWRGSWESGTARTHWSTTIRTW